MSDEVSPETANELRSRFFEDILTDLAEKTEAFQLVIKPLGDAIGWRVEMYITEDEDLMFLAGASNKSALAAGSLAVARGVVKLEEIVVRRAEDAENLRRLLSETDDDE